MGCTWRPCEPEGSLRLADGGGWTLWEDGGGSRCDGWEDASSSTSGVAALVVAGVVVVGGGGLAAGASEDHGGEKRVKECLSSLPGARNIGEWFAQGQVLSKGFEHWGAKTHLQHLSKCQRENSQSTAMVTRGVYLGLGHLAS